MSVDSGSSGLAFGRSRFRRTGLWVLLFIVGVLPILATASRHAQSGGQAITRFFRDRADIVSAWSQPRAGENDRAAATNGKAAALLRAHGIDRYAVTRAFQDNPGLYQGTVTTAWPAQPAWEGRFRLRLISEDAGTCKVLGTTDEAALDDCG